MPVFGSWGWALKCRFCTLKCWLWGLKRQFLPKKRWKKGCNFLLAAGSFPVTLELFCLWFRFWVFCLELQLELLSLQWVSASTKCLNRLRARSSTVSKKTPTVCQKSSSWRRQRKQGSNLAKTKRDGRKGTEKKHDNLQRTSRQFMTFYNNLRHFVTISVSLFHWHKTS